MNREDDLDKELRDHVDLEAEDRMDAGDPQSEARAAAIRQLGSVALIKEDVREAWGTAYPDRGYWSPDGSRILLNFEDGFALTDSSGRLFENLSSLTTGDDWTSSVGWLGSQCVVYVGGKDYSDSQNRPAKVLILKTRKIVRLGGVLG